MPPKKIEVNAYEEELESKVLECLRDERVWDVCVGTWDGGTTSAASGGHGASAVLRRAAEAVERKELAEFDTVIELLRHAGYGSPREAQRAVAEQLRLERAMMARFDKADEDDDFSGVPASKRGMIPEVAEEIRGAVERRRVLLLLRNVLADESAVIDFEDLEIPIVRWGPHKVLWTFGWGFAHRRQIYDTSRLGVMLERASAIVSVERKIAAVQVAPPEYECVYAGPVPEYECVYAEAVEVARYIKESSGGRLQATPSTVLRCLWYICLLESHTDSYPINMRRLHLADCFALEPSLQGEGDHAACWEMGKTLARFVRKAGGSVRQLWVNVMASRGLMPSSPESLPPKTIVIGWDVGERKRRIQSSQEGESYRWMAVTISLDDPNLHDLLDSICGRDDLERATSMFCNVSSIFWSSPWTRQALPDSFFESFANVRLLYLNGCIVGPIDSSFVQLRNLRILQMEECEVRGGQQSSVNASPLSLEQGGLGGPILFDSLWVLMLRNLDAGKFLLAGKAFDHMPNLHKFYLEGKTFAFPHLAAQKGLGSLSKLRINCPVQLEETDEGFFQHMHKLQSLDLSENTHIRFLPKFLSMAINLRKLNLDDCRWLESLNLNHLPATIEAVSLRSCISLQEVELADPTSLPNLKTFRLTKSVRITQLSLQGCRKLEQVDLQELLGLEVLDLSATAVKALEFHDLSRWYNLPPLNQLYLLGCEQLRRVDIHKLPWLDVLYLDSYSNNCSVDRCLETFKNQTEHNNTMGVSDSNGRRFRQAHIVVRDARLLRSLDRYFFIHHLDRTKIRIHIHVKCSSTSKRGDITDATTKPGARITSSTKSSPLIVSHLSTPRYTDVLDAMEDHPRPYRPSPPAMPLNRHIEVDGGNRRSLIEEESFGMLMRFAESLFVHENTSALAINVSMRWLKCFRIENCPNMEFVFADWDEHDNVLEELESMWLSHLPRLNAVCKWRIRIAPESYPQLKHIYLEFCSRIRYVLPSLPEQHNLETIDIRCCGELRAIFVDYDDDEEDKRGATPKLLPKLRSIHLEELPKLQHIYKPNICAPSLQDIVIRGCSSLRKLSLFDRSDGQSMRVVKISCEEDWWGNLKWDEPEANYCPFLFDPKHCPFYKKPKKARWS